MKKDNIPHIITKKEKIYYNTEYRKKIKALSKFNIFIKERISKRHVIQEIKLKKKKRLLSPLIYKNLYNFYKLIKVIYNKWIHKRTCDIKLSIKFYKLNSFFKNEKFYLFFKNQLVLELFFNGVIYFLLIINWLWINEWNKWASLTDILEYNFFNVNLIFKYINFFFSGFICYLYKAYKKLLWGFFYDMNLLDNQINLYNLFLFDSLDFFFVLYNVEDIKFEHEKRTTPEKNWKNIKKASFNYLKKDLLNDYFYISFFSFGMYEFHIISNQYNSHYLTFSFFEYRINYIIENNYFSYLIFKKKERENIFNFNFSNLNNLYTKIFRKNFFSIRVKYNLFLSNIDYFFFIKNLTYNYYIRNSTYFFEFASQRKYLLKYNNPASINRGSLTMWNYDKLYKKYLLFPPNNINDDLNLFNMERFEPFFNFYYRGDDNNRDYITTLFYKDLNIKLLHKLKTSDHFFFSIKRFFNFNLMDFYNLKNLLESYKEVMAIKSVYEYRFANSSFKNMREFMLTIFKTPLENFIYFDESYKNINYTIIFNIFSNVEKNFFFKDFYNINEESISKYYLHFLRFFSRLFKIRIHFFQFGHLWDLIENERNENLLKINVFRKFYNIFEKKKLFYLVKKIKRRDFYKRWSIQKFFNIIKYNSMFYLDVYNMSILFSGWIYEIIFFYRFMLFVRIYNKFSEIFESYEYYKYIVGFKDFFFQLVYENVEYSLIFILMNVKKIKDNNKFSYINRKNKVNNNFIYRKYMLYTWLEHNYYNDLFDDLDYFEKGAYSVKLSKWILRYFYEKSELHSFYSESLGNKFINNNRIFL